MATSKAKASEAKTTSKPRSKKRNDYVICRSVTAGGLNITCPSRNRYEFKSYGTQNEINYYDLVDLIRKGSEHIFLPRIIIEDDEFLEEYPDIKDMYEDMFTGRDLKDIIKLPIPEMERQISKLPVGAKETLKSLAASMIANGEIDSVSKIKALSEIYDSDFNLLSELFSR